MKPGEREELWTPAVIRGSSWKKTYEYIRATVLLFEDTRPTSASPASPPCCESKFRSENWFDWNSLSLPARSMFLPWSANGMLSAMVLSLWIQVPAVT